MSIPEPKTPPASAEKRTRARVWATLAAFIGIAVMLPFGSVAGGALVVDRPIESPDAIIMLASHEWERLPAAAAAARIHPGAVVLLTVPLTATRHNCHRCSERVDWLEREGVPRARIRLLMPTTNTYTEAVAAVRERARRPFHRLLIVTSPYHTRRALATFSVVFADTAVQIGVLPARPAQARPDRWWANAYDRAYVRYEWAALLKYWIQHGI